MHKVLGATTDLGSRSHKPRLNFIIRNGNIYRTMPNKHSIHPITVKTLHRLSKLLKLRSPFRTKNVSHTPESIVFLLSKWANFCKCYLILLSYPTSSSDCIYEVSSHYISKVIDSPVRKIYSDSLSFYYLCFFSNFLYFLSIEANWHQFHGYEHMT